MTLLDVLDRLDMLDIAIVSRGGRLITRAARGTIDDDLRAQIGTHRDMLLIVAVSRGTGHAPGPCTGCGGISMVAGWNSNGKPRDPWPRCRLTPGCEGRHQPREIDLARTAHKPAPKLESWKDSSRA